MHSIHDIILKINESFELPKADIYGIAQTIMRGQEKLPGVIGKKGEVYYVGVNDDKGIILYHKINGVVTGIKPKGYGDSVGNTANTYSMSMIVFLNRARVNMYPDELFTVIQSQTPVTVALEPYSTISTSFNSVILNDLQVFAQEYQIDYRLTPEQNLFQINYTVETTFLKDCFNTCET